MSNIDKQALREAADAANETSWGRWESYHPHKGARGYEVKVGVKAIAQHCLKVDSVFIALANPATVLALLDELEAAEKRIAELEGREINLPPYTYFDFKQGSPFSPGVYCRLDAVNAELSKLGIKFRAAGIGKGE
ncbi:ead/Ea22-like family protein [Citrobacter amalonaticus]|uniref:ead/Ea22-like family protein n=1 Tax=Citrobacter sp. CFNIH10 TaxID=1920110 RepID=UPI000CEC2D11|nr:ead/Ea22-like family protein [Citrobacter sp. CFNIH10]AUZ66897.1 hypothetical protein C2U53_25360 [Citrobacter sp. CFNIH10]